MPKRRTDTSKKTTLLWNACMSRWKVSPIGSHVDSSSVNAWPHILVTVESQDEVRRHGHPFCPPAPFALSCACTQSIGRVVP